MHINSRTSTTIIDTYICTCTYRRRNSKNSGNEGQQIITNE